MVAGLSWRKIPRAVGNPMQRIVKTEDEYNTFLEQSNGSSICFTSHNSYPTLGPFDVPLEVEINKVFFDFDSEAKPENALLDSRKLTRWCLDEGLPFAVAFSGGKGFHFYLLFEPQVYRINPILGSYIRAIQIWLRDKLDLRTLDEMIIGDTKRLCRIWYTRYATMKKISKEKDAVRELVLGDTICCPLTPAMVLSNSVQTIIDYSKNPSDIGDYFVPGTNGNDFKLHEFIKKYDIDVDKIDAARHYVKEIDIVPYKGTNTHFEELIKELFPKKCIHTQLLSDNPVHKARFCAVVHLKSIGYNAKDAFNLLWNLNWIDRDTSQLVTQINQIYNRRPPYKHMSCGAIKKEGFCVGKACERYWQD